MVYSLDKRSAIAFALLIVTGIPIAAAQTSDEEALARHQARIKLQTDCEFERQSELAETWDHAKSWPEKQRIEVAINSLCVFPPNGTSVYDSDVGRRITREAREFLLQCGGRSVPSLVAACRWTPDRNRDDHVVNLLGMIGDRRGLIPLCKRLLTTSQFSVSGEYFLANSISRIGDADTVGLLMEAYPWLTEGAQDSVVRIIGMSGTSDQLSVLLDWARSSDQANSALVHSLTGFKDPRCEIVFRKVLEDPRAWGEHYSAVAGLSLLGITDFDLASIPSNSNHQSSDTKYLEQARLNPRPLPRYSVRFTDPNFELRALVHHFIAARQAETAKGTSEHGLSLELVPPPRIVVGSTAPFSLVITNAGNRHQTILRNRDGSDAGWVCPIIRVEVWGPDHRRLQNGGARCGNVNRLSTRDFHVLAPGASFDVIQNTNIGHRRLTSTAFKRPGEYRMRAFYDTRTQAHGAIGDDGSRPVDVIPVQLSSPLVRFQY